MIDFFISYTQADEHWAKWIAWELEAAGYQVRIQAWDFLAGKNFVVEMQRATEEARRTIAVLSPAYLKSRFGRAEWAAGLATDPEGLEAKLVPVRVEPCDPTGLLKAITYIDLVGTDEATARKALLDHLGNRRLKPSAPPPFPGVAHGSGGRSVPRHPAFPSQETPARSPAPYVPRIGQKVTQLDEKRFLLSSFEAIREYFESGLEGVRQAGTHVQAELEIIHAQKFVAEIYVEGKLCCRAKIWMGTGFGMGQQICFSEGHTSTDTDNSFNEMLAVQNERDGLFLSATMGAAFLGNQQVGALDLKHLTSNEAAEYLWRRFVGPLER
jgi:hypothetical protein